MEFMNILQSGQGQVLHRADHCPVVGMSFRIEQLLDDMRGVSVRSIINPLSFFVLDDILLIVEGFLSDRGSQKTQPVCL